MDRAEKAKARGFDEEVTRLENEAATYAGAIHHSNILIQMIGPEELERLRKTFLNTRDKSKMSSKAYYDMLTKTKTQAGEALPPALVKLRDAAAADEVAYGRAASQFLQAYKTCQELFNYKKP